MRSRQTQTPYGIRVALLGDDGVSYYASYKRRPRTARPPNRAGRGRPASAALGKVLATLVPFGIGTMFIVF